jgi:membrane protease YdiL (CAAX protease family)
MMETEKHHNSILIKRSPVLAIFILAWALGASIIILVAQGTLPPNLALASALSASIAGIVMTALEDRKAGLKLMLSRLMIWRVKYGYWLFAIFLIVPVIILGSLFNPLFNGEPISFREFKPAFSILPMYMVFFIVAGLGQELGWTGFLIPRLQARFNALVSSVMRAVLVAIWHLPLFIYSKFQPTAVIDLPYSGWIAQVGFFGAILITTMLFLIPWSIFSTWIFNNTKGSILLVAVLHGSEIWVV